MPQQTVIQKIIFAIRHQPKSPNGVSKVAIAKYLKSEMGYENSAALTRALKKGIENGTLEQKGQSYRIVSDPQEVTQAESRVDFKDIVMGEGNILSLVGDSITVKYVGKLEDGTIFDAENSFEFTLGVGDVIKGWDQGLLGMKVGGKRELTVPPHLGYGKRGCGPDIPSNSTLNFEVEIIKIKRLDHD
jgi:FKBP-type peptidyl-prolyl cis-trans isomerase